MCTETGSALDSMPIIGITIYYYLIPTISCSIVEPHLLNTLAMVYYGVELCVYKPVCSLLLYALPQSHDIVTCRELILCAQSSEAPEGVMLHNRSSQ